MRIAVLSDSHLPGALRTLDALGKEPEEFFATAEMILHSGDVTSPAILDWLEQFAPVLCSTGNNDPIADERSLETQVLTVHGWTIGMIHSLPRTERPIPELQAYFPEPVDIMICGHTHQEVLEYREGVLIMNSGSITFPRHKDLRLGTVGLLDITETTVQANIICLGNTEGKPNPGTEMTVTVQR